MSLLSIFLPLLLYGSTAQALALPTSSVSLNPTSTASSIAYSFSFNSQATDGSDSTMTDGAEGTLLLYPTPTGFDTVSTTIAATTASAASPDPFPTSVLRSRQPGKRGIVDDIKNIPKQIGQALNLNPDGPGHIAKRNEHPSDRISNDARDLTQPSAYNPNIDPVYHPDVAHPQHPDTGDCAHYDRSGGCIWHTSTHPPRDLALGHEEDDETAIGDKARRQVSDSDDISLPLSIVIRESGSTAQTEDTRSEDQGTPSKARRWHPTVHRRPMIPGCRTQKAEVCLEWGRGPSPRDLTFGYEELPEEDGTESDMNIDTARRQVLDSDDAR